MTRIGLATAADDSLPKDGAGHANVGENLVQSDGEDGRRDETHRSNACKEHDVEEDSQQCHALQNTQSAISPTMPSDGNGDHGWKEFWLDIICVRDVEHDDREVPVRFGLETWWRAASARCRRSPLRQSGRVSRTSELFLLASAAFISLLLFLFSATQSYAGSGTVNLDATSGVISHLDPQSVPEPQLPSRKQDTEQLKLSPVGTVEDTVVPKGGHAAGSLPTGNSHPPQLNGVLFDGIGLDVVVRPTSAARVPEPESLATDVPEGTVVVTEQAQSLPTRLAGSAVSDPGRHHPGGTQPLHPTVQVTADEPNKISDALSLIELQKRDIQRLTVPRCRIMTYREPRPTVQQPDNEAQAVAVWRRAWWSKGWDPVVVGEGQARKHKDFDRLRASYDQLPTVNNRWYETQCYLRYLAYAELGGGWAADYDILPGNLRAPPAQSRLCFGTDIPDGLEPITPTPVGAAITAPDDSFRLRSSRDVFPMLSRGPPAAYNLAADAFAHYQPSKDDVNNGRPHVSDMTIARHRRTDLFLLTKPKTRQLNPEASGTPFVKAAGDLEASPDETLSLILDADIEHVAHRFVRSPRTSKLAWWASLVSGGGRAGMMTTVACRFWWYGAFTESPRLRNALKRKPRTVRVVVAPGSSPVAMKWAEAVRLALKGCLIESSDHHGGHTSAIMRLAQFDGSAAGPSRDMRNPATSYRPPFTIVVLPHPSRVLQVVSGGSTTLTQYIGSALLENGTLPSDGGLLLRTAELLSQSERVFVAVSPGPLDGRSESCSLNSSNEWIQRQSSRLISTLGFDFAFKGFERWVKRLCSAKGIDNVTSLVHDTTLPEGGERNTDHEIVKFAESLMNAREEVQRKFLDSGPR